MGPFRAASPAAAAREINGPIIFMLQIMPIHFFFKALNRLRIRRPERKYGAAPPAKPARNTMVGERRRCHLLQSFHWSSDRIIGTP